jgi:hypothetical protein
LQPNGFGLLHACVRKIRLHRRALSGESRQNRVFQWILKRCFQIIFIEIRFELFTYVSVVGDHQRACKRVEYEREKMGIAPFFLGGLIGIGWLMTSVTILRAMGAF